MNDIGNTFKTTHHKEIVIYKLMSIPKTKEKRGVKLIDGRYGKSYQNTINEINIAKELYPEVKARLDGEIKRLDKWQSEKKDFKSPVICFRFSDNVFYVYSACIKNLLRFDVQQILISTSSLLYLKRW